MFLKLSMTKKKILTIKFDFAFRENMLHFRVSLYLGSITFHFMGDKIQNVGSGMPEARGQRVFCVILCTRDGRTGET